jgi:hypothetical protein
MKTELSLTCDILMIMVTIITAVTGLSATNIIIMVCTPQILSRTRNTYTPAFVA